MYMNNILHLSTFRLTVIPSDMSQCHKLHAFNYAGNKLSDKRLAKMMDQCSTKAVLGKYTVQHVKHVIYGHCFGRSPAL